MHPLWWGLLGLLAGVALGGAGVWLLWRLRSGSDTPDAIARIRRDNERFRQEVDAHFIQTAELINQLTDSYKAVFDHLSDGAERLVDRDAVRERMPQVSAREVRLRHIGAPREHPEKPPDDAADGERET